MAENTPKLAYLLDPLFQIENVNGKPLVGGYIEVYYAGTNEKYITYQNFDFTQNPFKIPLGSDGRAVVLAQTEQAYDVYVRDSFGNLVFSRLNIAPGGAGGVAFGMTKVSHDDTLTGNGTQLSPLGVSPLTNLAVDETMTAYEATVEGKESLVLGVNGDWFNSAISGISNDFVTNETFSACCSAVKGGLDNKVDLSALNNYYTKTETWNTFLPRSGLDLSNYYTTAQTYNKYEIEDRLDGKQDRLTFGYDENSAISSINNSALAAGQGGDTTPWISGAKILADTQTMTDNMIIQVLSSFTLSGNKNHCIAVKGGVYRFPNKWEIASGIAETNYFIPQSSMSGYLPTSSFTSYTASIASNLENNWNYTNSAYSLSINNFYNKLDASAFSAWSAVQDPVLIGDSNITAISSKVDSHIQWNLAVNAAPVITDTRLIGDNCITAHTTETSGEWIVGLVQSAYEAIDSVGGISSDVETLKNASGNYYPMTGNPSGFLTSHQSLTDYYKKTETSSKEEISAAIAAIPGGDVEVNNVVHNYSAAGTWLTSHQDISNLMPKSESANFYPMTGNPSGFLTAHQSLSNYYTKTDTSSKQEISAALQYISSNAGKTYTGVDPIQVNNSTNEISITGEALSAGPNIDIFASGGYVVISANGGNSFPITGTNGTTGFTANMDCSSMYLSTGAGPAGAIVNLDTKGVHFEAYPSTDVSASWYNIITQQDKITCSSVKLTTAASENRFYTSALPNLNEITFIAPSYGPYGTYSALIDDSDTTFVVEVDSGCCVKVVRAWSDDRHKNCWFGLNQETYFYIG